MDNKPIVSVNIMGGLGNQMFQLATAYSYSKKYNGTLQIIKNKLNDDGRPIYWDSVLHRFKPFLVDNLPNTLSIWRERGATEYSVVPQLPQNGTYLSGYLQSSKYFNDSQTINELKELFKPSQECLDLINSKYSELIRNKERVIVVHARRTDYLRNEYVIKYHGPLDVQYYKEAITKMLLTVENPLFLFSSDDSTFWDGVFKEIPELTDKNKYILDGENEINTLALLQQFSYFIIANSTFSWWATWLSDSKKKVIAPSKWFGPTGPQNYKDIYCDDWELI
jgi:hypothetical protein